MIFVGTLALVVGVLGIFSRFKKKLLSKIFSAIFLSGICLYGAMDFISIYWTAQHLKWGYIKTVFQPEFIRQSGVTFPTLLTGISILILSVLLPVCFAFFVKIKKMNPNIVVIFIFTGLLTFYFYVPAKPDYKYFPFLKNREVSDVWNIAPAKTANKNPSYVFVIVGEGIRSELLNADQMPQLNAMDGTVYPKNFSTANATHFGLFTILTGLFPNFYQDAIEKNWQIPFFSWLKDEGYRSAALNSDFFNWMSLDHLISKNNFEEVIEITKDDRSEGDRLVFENVKKIVNSNNGIRFFFIKLNGTHHNYFYPKKFEFYKPVVPIDFNFLLNSPQENIEQIRNRYLNSVRYFDFLVGDFVNFLKVKDLWNKSIVLITADHGEEFYEGGSFLHSTALNYYQNSAFLLIHRPGDKSREVSNIQSSHLDIVPTLIKLLGGEKPQWMKGLDLFGSPIPKDRVVFSAWHAGLEMGAMSFNRDRTVFSELVSGATEEDKNFIDEGLPYYHQLFE